MKITNKFNLPQPFVSAVDSDSYERGQAEYTATELVRPVRITALLDKYGQELEEDASDRVWALQGDTKHVVFQKIAARDPERYIVEERFYASLPGTKKRVSARLDLFDKKTSTLFDWKETSVWKFMLGDTRDWEEQANINLYCLRMNGIKVERMQNIAILKDWKVRMARNSQREEYPKCAIHVVDLPMWSVAEQQSFILNRMNLLEHARHEIESGRDPMLCTRKERWQREQGFALCKKGQKRAIKVFEDEHRAKAMLLMRERSAKPGEKFEIQKRPTEPTRCLDYCPVWSKCDFGRKARIEWERETQNGT